MELNKFQQRVMSLWKYHKHTGLVIEAPRQIGKSEVALQIAYQESDKDTAVIFYGFNTNSTKLKEEQYKHKYHINDNVFFVSAQHKVGIENVRKCCNEKYKNVFHIYDEAIDKTTKENTLKIYTEVQENMFRFGEEWFDGTTVTEGQLIDKKNRLSLIYYASQFNCCIMKRVDPNAGN